MIIRLLDTLCHMILCNAEGSSGAHTQEVFIACGPPALKFFATKLLEMHVRSAFVSQSGTAGSRSVISSLLNLGVSLRAYLWQISFKARGKIPVGKL